MPEFAGAEFAEIYENTLDLLRERLNDKGAPIPAFESIEVAPYCFIGVPRDLLLGLDGDDLFLTSAYFKVLDRAIEPDELAALKAALSAGSLTRERVLVDLEIDEDGFERSVRTEWV
jgi:hypothetical protein